jgi:hypothetical protein
MTVLTFPTSPIIGQRYNAPNEIQYVFDGVKWIVETVATTSAAVTNSVQDRVAPMFVAGPNTGIAFTYNAGTNVMSASVTAVNGNQLVNGSQSVTLESNGNITAPAFTIPNTAGTSGQVLKWPSSGTTLAWGSDSNTTDRLVSGSSEVVLTESVPAGGAPTISGPLGVTIGATDGKQLSLNWTPAAVDPYPGVPDLSTTVALVNLDYSGVIIEVNSAGDGSYWKFTPTGALVHSQGSATRTKSILIENNITTQVVWTGRSFTSGAKLTIQVECRETGGVNGTSWETQVCEAIVAVRGYNTASVPVISVYGVTHTSAAPLMTFTVDRNPVSNLIEIVGTRTATASPLGQATLTIYSVETRTND